MAKIIPFPVKLLLIRGTNSTGKSDMMEVIDHAIDASRNHGRSQGFLIGATVSSIIHLIMQYLIR